MTRIPQNLYKAKTVLFALLGAILLQGCATRTPLVLKVRANPQLARRLPRNERHDPVLQRVSVTFKTLAGEKRPTAGVWLLVADNTWNNTLVRASNLASTAQLSNRYVANRRTYWPHSINTIDLPFERSRYGYGFFISDKDPSHLLSRIPRSQRRVWHKSHCEHLYFRVGLMARSALLGTTGNTFGFTDAHTFSGYGGSDRWRFDAFLTLFFSDGSKLVYEQKNVVLDSRHGQLVFSGTGS